MPFLRQNGIEVELQVITVRMILTHYGDHVLCTRLRRGGPDCEHFRWLAHSTRDGEIPGAIRATAVTVEAPSWWRFDRDRPLATISVVSPFPLVPFICRRVLRVA